jgi:signal peptidase I
VGKRLDEGAELTSGAGQVSNTRSTTRKSSHLAREIIETIVLTVLIFLVVQFAVQNFRVEGISMEPGLQNNEFVLVNKLAYDFHAPQRGDVIVFHYPLDPQEDFIKRIIGLPGDTVKITPTQIYVDGHLLTEPYISHAYNANVNTWHLGSGQYFVMGDNRPESYDSRSWGPVPASYIIGKAALIYWPLNNIEFVPTYSTVYAAVPKK